ncbi:MAG TPA: type II secretion system F family protein [Candidatus Mediterraneibacter intestinipullorum]|nr:type II secretion system F family protein [Candidatus Mediterraneibacter intestinipullorum]
MPGLQILDYIMIGAGAVSLIIWMVFYIKGLKYNAMFDVLEEKEYPFKEIYGLGYAVLQLVKYNYKSKGDRKLRQQLNVLYGSKYSDYYLRVIHSQQVTLAFTLFVLSFAFYGLTAEVLASVVGFMFAGVAYYYFGTTTAKKILKRSDELLHDFSEVVSKLALLTNAGMILREAWQEVAEAGDSIIYTEMQTAVNDMNNGMAEIDAIFGFGTRCIIPEIKKFTSTIIQGMTKGNSELTEMLQEQSKEVWQLKKQLVRREGEKAASKLLIPICVMFVGILIMILIPIFTNLGVS